MNHGILSDEMIALAQDPEAIRFHADQIRVNGVTTIEAALPVEFIEAMLNRFDELMEAHRSSSESNRGADRFQMFLPLEPPFTDPMLYEHPAVLAIVEATLGDRLNWSYLASDTPFPGADYQRIHADTQLLFPETNFSAPPYGLVVNIPLVDVTEENGPLEYWPGGTHYMPSRMDLEAHAKTMVSKLLTIEAGSLIIRDPRMWHRGTPHRGTRSRPHMALVYTRPWYRFEQKPPTVRRSQLESLSEKTQSMLRHANIVEG